MTTRRAEPLPVEVFIDGTHPEQLLRLMSLLRAQEGVAVQRAIILTGSRIDPYCLANLALLSCEPGTFPVRRAASLGEMSPLAPIRVLLAEGICWMRRDALVALSRFVLANPTSPVAHAAVLGDGRTDYILQVMGRVPLAGVGEQPYRHLDAWNCTPPGSLAAFHAALRRAIGETEGTDDWLFERLNILYNANAATAQVPLPRLALAWRTGSGTNGGPPELPLSGAIQHILCGTSLMAHLPSGEAADSERRLWETRDLDGEASVDGSAEDSEKNGMGEGAEDVVGDG